MCTAYSSRFPRLSADTVEDRKSDGEECSRESHSRAKNGGGVAVKIAVERLSGH